MSVCMEACYVWECCPNLISWLLPHRLSMGEGAGVVAAAASRLTHNENEHPPVVKLSFDLQTSTYFLPSIFRLLLN